MSALIVRSAYCALLLCFCLAFAPRTSAAPPALWEVADDVTVKISSGYHENNLATFKNAKKPGVTSGSYSESDSGPWADWTWVKDGDDFKVYDNLGRHDRTFVGAANPLNEAGPIDDGTAPEEHGGSWTTPDP